MIKKILVADDEEIIRNYVTRALSSRGYSVGTASDGASALALAKKEEFDLVICDLKMPDMRGEEVIRELKILRPRTKVILITGSVSDISNPVTQRVAVEGFLIKPFGINEIRDLAAKVIGAGD
ncbi:MAG: response regulator [Elusimicrobia bacterium]|nr:response regulator [Elusimicrobiota bacterium]